MRAEIKLITPHLAKIYLEKNNGNRRIRDKTVMFYADQMKRNLWHLSGQGISFDTSNNLLDGQHRLLAIVKSNKAIKMLVIFDVDPEAFKFYDTGKNRNAADVLSISDVSNASNVASGISYYMRLMRDYSMNRTRSEFKLSNSDVLDIYNSDSAGWQDAYRFSNKCYRNMRVIQTAMIMGFVYYLINEKKHRKEVVYSFFSGLTDVEPTDNELLRKTRSYLINNNISTSKMTANTKAILIARAFNAYIRGINKLRVKINPNDKIYLP